MKVEYKDPELIENPPSTPVINKVGDRDELGG